MKTIIQRFISIIFVAFSLTAFMPVLAHADSLFGESAKEACSGAHASDTAECTGDAKGVNNVLKAAIDIFSVIVGIAAVIMFIAGGMRFVTSGGDPNNVAKAKASLTYAIVGIVVVALAQVMVRYVFAKAAK